MLGLLVGSAVDVNGRSGAGWGAGGGALLGLGMALLDSRGKSKVWGLRAGVGISRDGLEPTDADLRRGDGQRRRRRTWDGKTACPPLRTN